MRKEKSVLDTIRSTWRDLGLGLGSRLDWHELIILEVRQEWAKLVGSSESWLVQLISIDSCPQGTMFARVTCVYTTEQYSSNYWAGLYYSCILFSEMTGRLCDLR